MFEHKTSTQIGKGLTCTKCSCETVISASSVQSLQKALLAAATTDGEILAAFRPEHDLRSNLRVPNFKIFSGGAYPQTLRPSYALLVHQHIGRTNLK